MNVIKRNGTIQPFNPDKIRTSLLASGASAQSELNESDANFLVEEISGVMNGLEQITSLKIYYIVVGVLYATGFKKTVESYVSYRTNAWK
jgi:transcriptional regulator NrdR family protein